MRSYMLGHEFTRRSIFVHKNMKFNLWYQMIEEYKNAKKLPSVIEIMGD